MPPLRNAKRSALSPVRRLHPPEPARRALPAVTLLQPLVRGPQAMNRIHFLKTLAVATLAALTLSTSALAEVKAKGTKAEAEAMVAKAMAYLKANGPDKAYIEFTNGSTFKDRDLYVIVYDLTGKNLAHGANPKLVGKDLIGLKDPDGKLLNKMLVDLAKEKGKGWSDEFKFRNPTTESLQRRIVYVERAGETFVGTGVFLD
jgi:signal transduction histidine kinase